MLLCIPHKLLSWDDVLLHECDCKASETCASCAQGFDTAGLCLQDADFEKDQVWYALVLLCAWLLPFLSLPLSLCIYIYIYLISLCSAPFLLFFPFLSHSCTLPHILTRPLHSPLTQTHPFLHPHTFARLRLSVHIGPEFPYRLHRRCLKLARRQLPYQTGTVATVCSVIMYTRS